MKQNSTKYTLLFMVLLSSSFLYSQSYNVSIDGISENIIALSGNLPAPCVETFSGEMVTGTPLDGCSPLTNPNDLIGKIAVLDRGSCNFTYKIQHAQDAGAIAVIICNNRTESEGGGGVIVMQGDESELGTINLFAVMISKEQCATFKSNLPLRATFSAEIIDNDTPDSQVLWGNEPGQGDFDGGLNGWTTKTISCDSNSSTIETWKYDPDGILDEGALSIGEAPGPSFCNGMMAFDSDYLDNEGTILNSDGTINTGAVGTGPCPAPQIGELISPIIDLSGSNIEGVSLEFYQETRQFNSAYFVQFSTDGGENYSQQIPINEEIGRHEFNEVSKMTIPLLGAAGASQLRVKFIYSGNYYYWLIDDVRIIIRPPNNLKIDKNFFAVPSNIRIPKSQVSPINFLTDIQNIGSAIQEHTTLSINVTNNTSGENVFSDSLNLGSILPDSTKKNNLLPNSFTPKTEIAKYTGTYTVSSDSTDVDLNDNTRTINFEVTENEFAKEDGTNLVNFEIQDKNQTPTWSIGNSFYIPKGCGYKISGIGLGIGNSDEVGGLEVGIRIFKWTDSNQDIDEDGFIEIAPNEREFIGFADYEVLGNELIGEVKIVGDISPANGNNAPILLEDETYYLVMLTMDSRIGISAKNNLYSNYLAMNTATTIIGLPRYWSFLGYNDDVYTTVYTSNTQNTPLVRMYIESVVSRPNLSFGADTLTANCAPFTVNFKDSTTFETPITSWSWNLGDGHTSNLQHPTHTYTDFGNYSISLTVIDRNGCTETLTKNNYIEISSNITGRDTAICSGQTIDLNNLIDGTPLNNLEYGTTFGTYDKSNIQKLVTTTTFFVRDANPTTMCVDTTKIVITVNNQPNIIGRDTAICKGQSVDLSNLVSGNILNNLEIGSIFNNYLINTPRQNPTDTTTFFFRDSIATTTCKDTTALTVFVENQPLITGRDTAIMVGQTINLGNLLKEPITGSLDYGTMFGTYGLSNPITPTTTQTYFIRDSIENEIGCKDTTKVVVNIPLANLSLIDIDGDGTPDITDPCNCFDSENVRVSANGQTKVTLFHDFVIIHNGGIGQTWVLDEINSGAVLQKIGTPFPNNTPLIDLGNGTYRLDFWHQPDIGFNASFRRLSDNATETTGNSCQEQACIIIPTFSQWGLLIFGLLIINLSLLIIFRLKFTNA